MKFLVLGFMVFILFTIGYAVGYLITSSYMKKEHKRLIDLVNMYKNAIYDDAYYNLLPWLICDRVLNACKNVIPEIYNMNDINTDEIGIINKEKCKDGFVIEASYSNILIFRIFITESTATLTSVIEPNTNYPNFTISMDLDMCDSNDIVKYMKFYGWIN